MTSEAVYRRMFDVMTRRGGRYTGVDVPEFYAVARELFTPEEAVANNAMPKGLFTAAQLARELGRSEDDTSALLETMAGKALCFSVRIDGRRLYAAARFVPGIFEFQFMRGTTTDKDKLLARLIHEYKQAVDARTGPVEIKYPAHRVITVDRKVEAGTRIHTYQQVDEYIDKNDLIAVASC
ncbi:MAG: hypothetical protein KKB20_11100, partial [Proteobacteria bacterium]|nr:hypothetical protein [Pseudomonadota bacterium]